MKLKHLLSLCLSLLFSLSIFAQSTLYGIIDNKWVTINPNTAEVTVIATLSPGFTDFSGMTYHAGLDQILAVANRVSNPRLISIDRLTGEITDIGLIDLPTIDIQLIEAMEYNPNDGLLYAAGEDDGPPSNFFSSRLMVVDPTTGNATQVANITGTCQDEGDGFAFTDGATYTMDGCPDPEILYSIDLSTGVATFIGATNVQGTLQMTIQASSGLIYTINPFTTQLITISPTANTTIIGVTHDPADFNGEPVRVMTFAPSIVIDSCALDSIPPTAVCQNLTVNAGPDGTVTLSPEDVDGGSYDNCLLDSLWIEPIIVSCGENVVSLFARDSAQLIASCFAIVTVLDVDPPEIICPDNLTIDAAPTDCGMEVIFDLPTLSDNCSNAVAMQTAGLLPGDFFPLGETMQTYLATDEAGNSSTCSFTVTIAGGNIGITCPPDIIIDCNTPTIPPFTGFPGEICSGFDISIQDSIIMSNCEQNYDLLRTWSATDSLGDVYSCVQVISLRDTLAPIINCPADTTIECESVDPSQTGMAAATDNCADDISISFSDSIISGDCNNACIIERTWTATDPCGNSSSCIQNITQNNSTSINGVFDVDIDGDGIADPIQLGISQHTVTIEAADASCLLQWLPGVDGQAWPLTRENVVLNSSDCTPGNNPVNNEGQLMNPLMAEVLILDIRLRLDSTIGNIYLDSFDCDFHPIIFQYMPNNPTVRDLYELAQIALGNLIGPPHLEAILEALCCVNGPFEFCDPGSSTPTPLPLGEVEEVLESIELFPNPTKDKINLIVSDLFDQKVYLEILDLNGKALYKQVMHIESPTIEINLEPLQLACGVYLISLYYDKNIISKRFVME